MGVGGHGDAGHGLGRDGVGGDGRDRAWHVAATPDALPCHEDMASPAAMPQADTDHAAHAGKGDCCKLGSCDCLQHCSLALLTLPAVPAALAGRPAMPDTLAEGRANPVPEQPVRPPIA